MESLTAQVSKIVGTPNPKSWSQVYTFFPQDQEKREKRGILLAVLSFSSGIGEEEITAVGREILSRLHEEYYGEVTSSVFDRLTNTTQKICREFTTEDRCLELAMAVLVEKAIYLTIIGSGEVWLKRQGVLARVIKGQGKEIRTASGFIERGDLLVLGTTSFFRLCPEGVLRAAVETGETVESLNTLVHSQEIGSEVAAGRPSALLRRSVLETKGHRSSGEERRSTTRSARMGSTGIS